MKRGCFISLLAWAACAYGYWYFAHGRLVGNLRWAGPVIAGLIMAMVIGALRNAYASGRDAARFSSEASTTGVIGERPKDGDVVTVSGHIRASGSPMRAPLSGRPAVLYTYDISHTRQSQRSAPEEVNDFAGYGLSPAIIDSPYGPIRLLGFPTLEMFAKETLDDAAVRPNAEKYIVETEFTNLGGFHPGLMYSEIKNLISDDEGHLKKDWCMTPPRPVPEPAQATPAPQAEENDPVPEWVGEVLADRHFAEQLVAPGEQVSAIGRYSAQKGGLVPDLSRPLELLRGDAHAAAGKLWGKMAVQIVGALIFGAALNGIIFGVLKIHKPGPPFAFSRETIESNIEAMHDAARNGDVARIEQLVKDGMPVDARDSNKSTPLMRASAANVASWLIAHGADVNATNANGETPLMSQAQLGHADIVKLLVASHANLDAQATTWKTTALQFALDDERLDVARVLRDAGAKDETVTAANGTPVADDSDPVRVCRQYLDAVQREDRAALGDLSTFGASAFADVDFKTWKNSRFANGRLVSGYAKDDAATVTMRGSVPSGVYVTWTYQLVRRNGAWKISGERWETRLNGSEP